MTKLVLLFALTAACTSPTVSAGTEITGADAADAAINKYRLINWVHP